MRIDSTISVIDPVIELEARSKVNDTARKKILLVEDEAIIAMAESEMIRHHGYKVVTALSGEEAVETIKADPSIHLVLMDIDLGGGIDGTVAANRILSVKNIPVVFLTSHSEREMVEKVRGITRYGYVIKNSGDFVLLSSIEMAFELFDAHEKTKRHEHSLGEHQVELETLGEELRRSRHELETSHREYIDLYDQTSGGFFTLSGKGLITKANLTAAAMLGMEREGLTGTALLGFVARDDEAVYYTHLKRLVSTGLPQLCEVRMTRKDGSLFWVSMQAAVVHGEHEETPSYQIAISDITDRRQAEEKLRESEECFRGVFEKSPIGIAIVDSAEQRILHANRSFSALTGYSPDELAMMTIESITHPDDRQTEKELLNTYKEKPVKPFQMEKRYVRKDGEIRLVRLTGDILEFNTGGPPLGVGNVIDITEQRKVEEELQKLLKQKELLLKEVHHRIKNNMSTMMSLLLLQSKAQKNPETVKVLKDTMNRLQSMEVLYDKLYRSEDFREISIKDYLPPLINEIVGTFPHKAMVTIETEMADLVLSARVLSPLGIIMNELITNSMKYAFVGRNEGVIKVSVSLNNNRVILVFEDNGNGVLPSVNIESSTGFGLQLVDLLAKQLKGSIRLERQEGAQFILEFEV